MVNWTYNPNQYQEHSFALIPIGDYRARIEEVNEKTYNSGNEGFEIVLSINGQPGRMWYNLVLDAANPERTNQRIGEFFDSFGITNPALGTGKQWIGMVGAVRIKHEIYEGSERARVAYVIARSRQDSLPAWQERGPVNATATATAAPVASVTIPTSLPFEI